MKLIISTTPVYKQVYRNQFKIVINFMFGDADGNATTKLWVRVNNPHLTRFIDFLTRLNDEYKHGKGGYDGYAHVEDYTLFCGYGNEINDEVILRGRDMSEEEYEKEYTRMLSEMEPLWQNPDIEQLRFNWKFDPACDYQCPASYRGYKITYFDHEGIEYPVQVKR